MTRAHAEATQGSHCRAATRSNTESIGSTTLESHRARLVIGTIQQNVVLLYDAGHTRHQIPAVHSFQRAQHTYGRILVLCVCMYVCVCVCVYVCVCVRVFHGMLVYCCQSDAGQKHEKQAISVEAHHAQVSLTLKCSLPHPIFRQMLLTYH